MKPSSIAASLLVVAASLPLSGCIGWGIVAADVALGGPPLKEEFSTEPRKVEPAVCNQFGDCSE